MLVEILGPVRADGLEVGGPRVRALLVLLAMEAGRVIPADQLIDGLYGEHPPDDAANALQSQVSRLRRALGRQFVEHTAAGYRLAVDPLQVDLHRFEQLAAEGRRALAEGDPSAADSALSQALDLWRGVPEAAPAIVTRLAERRLAVVEDGIEARLDLGRHRELVAELSELVHEHPLRERLRAQLIRALYGSGRQADALASYEEGRRILDEELGVEPGPELAAAQLAVLRADPALNALKSTRQGLRAQLTSFVGRADELATVETMLGETRLVTLIGAGGAGKTRLAVEAAGRAPGDVCVVELATVLDDAEVPVAVLEALGIREAAVGTAGRSVLDPTARLVTALAERKLLLVLDNCEHLVGAAAELADRLLSACPSLRVLATSREALGITGEAIYPVSPLRVPASGTPADQALDYPAVRLFADRAAAARQGFTLDEGNIEVVLRICRALDGLPLAIELAAARLRTLPPAELATRIDDRFRLLARGSRTAMPRHQTLRAVVAWSWELLDAEEQAMARRLTVFVGGARLAAATEVCGLPEEVLLSLVDKSLVEELDGRYRMLETIRAFCAEELAAAGEVATVRQAHADHYLRLAESTEATLRGADQLEALALLDEERDDLNAALRWAIEEGRTTFGLRLVANLACYWWLRGHRVTSATLAADLLRQVPRPAEKAWEEYALCVLVASWAGVTGELRERLDGLRPFAASMAHFPYGIDILNMLMSVFIGPPADLDVEDMAAFPREGLSPWVGALTHMGPAFVWFNLGQHALARQGFQRGLEGFRAVGDRWGITLALSGLIDLEFEEGHHAGALALADEALALSEQIGSVADVAEYLCRRADCLVALGEYEQAESCYHRSADLSRRAGSVESLSRAILGMGELALISGDPDRAEDLISQSMTHNPADWYSSVFIQARAELALGRLAMERGDLGDAHDRFLGLLLRCAESIVPTAHQAVRGLAEVAGREGDSALAERLLTASPAEALEIVSAR
ncbi:BTAD domain-containing putative transcriptional regulator [Nonomuraea soli]|uniref:Putative ATPase n=1 Tax=Nonomuraea soli TaxID=1032476 RepID=A0A7W0CLF4_9ACTN|nr:BTAD domain-containing putative transcriptional regulator [Nonomuraea soli]MBA2893353.1 putative ATPase [Nonomuraea soli]